MSMTVTSYVLGKLLDRRAKALPATEGSLG